MNRHRYDGKPVRDTRDGSDRSMRAGDSMNFFPGIFLIEGHGSEDWRQNHPGSMNKSERLVQAYRTACFRSCDSGGKNRIISGRDVHTGGDRAERRV